MKNMVYEAPEEPNSNQMNFEQDQEKGPQCGIDLGQVRLHFIRKVLCIIFCQMMISVLFVLAALFITPFRDFQAENTVLLLIMVLVEIALFLLMICYNKVCKRVPYNYICLFVFTIAVSYILASICAKTKPEAVLVATVATAAVVFLLGVWSFCTTRDLTMNVGILLYVPVGGIILILFLTVWRAAIIQIIISLIIVAIFSIFLAYDLQKLRGKFGVEYSVDDYVYAALSIYIDIVLIFKNLLYIFGGTK